ncbi:MAG: alpha-L-fucosidase, partial [Phycisphaerae bacterium]|nr:alpha-L-fucosidase [Phycisphaerae bacterium]
MTWQQDGTVMRFNDQRDWFFQKRFGLFIHWGLYAIHGLHEQEQQRYDIPAAEYVRLINEFDPVRFDPNRWLDLAEDAGMEYMVFTTKHHDGFCLW